MSFEEYDISNRLLLPFTLCVRQWEPASQSRDTMSGNELRAQVWV